MSPLALPALLSLAAALSGITAQIVSDPLVNQQFAYGSQPYQVETVGDIRGKQVGYNICNATTQNQDSMCQTMLVNHIDDWCLWSSPQPDETIANTEGVEVAWCTKPSYGTRVIPEGALQGVTWVTTPDYIMIYAFLDQTLINLLANDSGGELDPHGADLQGNPIGGLVYSNSYPTGNTNNNSYTQVVEWTEFIGNGEMCLKICNPAKANANNVGLCNNIYDEIGIFYNCPSSAQNGSFVVCDGDSMSPVGQYVVDGTTTMYQQPATGPITSLPYTPTIPATSNCVTYQSTAIYTDLFATTSSAPSGAPTSSPTGSSGVSGSVSRSGSGSSPTATGAAANGNGAASLHISGVATLFGVALTIAFLS